MKEKLNSGTRFLKQKLSPTIIQKTSTTINKQSIPPLKDGLQKPYQKSLPKPTLKTQSLGVSVDLIVTENLLNKIKYLCSRISNQEWSGILLYKVEGSIEEKNLKCICDDVFPMDKGSAGYTEYEFNEDFIAYLYKHPEKIEMNIGHVH